MPTSENIPVAPETQPAPESKPGTTASESTPTPPHRGRTYVGAAVLYAMHRDTPCQGEHRPARVVRVGHDTVNLVVDLDGGNDSPTYDPAKSPPSIHRSGVTYGLEPGQWCWPDEVA